MGEIWDRIREAIRSGKVYYAPHARERMRRRGILAWQVEAGSEHAELLEERPAGRVDGPRAVVRFPLPDGSLAVSVWEQELGAAKLITVYGSGIEV